MCDWRSFVSWCLFWTRIELFTYLVNTLMSCVQFQLNVSSWLVLWGWIQTRLQEIILFSVFLVWLFLGIVVFGAVALCSHYIYYLLSNWLWDSLCQFETVCGFKRDSLFSSYPIHTTLLHYDYYSDHPNHPMIWNQCGHIAVNINQ